MSDRQRQRPPRVTRLWLTEPFHWSLVPTPTPADFLAALALVPPPGAYLYLEGTNFWASVARQLSDRRVEPALDFLPDGGGEAYHLPAVYEVLLLVSRLFAEHPDGVSHHVKVYDAQGLLVSWHDADTGWPVCLGQRLGSATMRVLAKELGCTRRRHPTRA